MMELLQDFPKLECPFIRKTFQVDPEDFKQQGKKLHLRKPEVYLVVDTINPGYEWVFNDPQTFAVEKLDGTNVKIKTHQGRLVGFQNRKNPIDPLQILSGQTHLIEGLFRAIGKGYVTSDGEQAGELMGPKINGNPYGLDFHEWYPFDKAMTDLRYSSFHQHDRTFDNWSSWFKDWLHSRFYSKIASKKGIQEKLFAEGVVFYNLDRKAQGKTWMAKLRRDMFSWYYQGVNILDY